MKGQSDERTALKTDRLTKDQYVKRTVCDKRTGIHKYKEDRQIENDLKRTG